MQQKKDSNSGHGRYINHTGKTLSNWNSVSKILTTPWPHSAPTEYPLVINHNSSDTPLYGHCIFQLRKDDDDDFPDVQRTSSENFPNDSNAFTEKRARIREIELESSWRELSFPIGF